MPQAHPGKPPWDTLTGQGIHAPRTIPDLFKRARAASPESVDDVAAALMATDPARKQRLLKQVQGYRKGGTWDFEQARKRMMARKRRGAVSPFVTGIAAGQLGAEAAENL